MTQDVDTSAEAVERLSAAIEPHPGYGMCRACDEYQAVEEHAQAAATLRALVAERDELLAELRATHEKHKHAQEMWAMHASSDRTHRAECRRLAAENARLRAALEIIAGKRQCIDNLMGDKDVARAALAGDTSHG